MIGDMKLVQSLNAVPLFEPLSALLITVLERHPDDWLQPTKCSDWTVKDVVAHLIGGSLSRLPNVGPWAAPDAPPADFAGLISWINRENHVWVHACRRINPPMLLYMLAGADRALMQRFAALDPNARAPIAVSWAEDAPSTNWFDIAREYTEKWHHQQHIREALGEPLLLERTWLHPVLATFVRGLPKILSSSTAAAGTRVALSITGDAGGDWTAEWQAHGWILFDGLAERVECRVTLDQDMAWRLFTKEIRDARAAVSGDALLGARMLELVAIMA